MDDEDDDDIRALRVGAKEHKSSTTTILYICNYNPSMCVMFMTEGDWGGQPSQERKKKELNKTKRTGLLSC